ncbi:hypothetical protein VIBHAR_01561 [Vibrio campbellii ATCC BAA-1116]|uniref:Uncharacterized protein n=1 Tax=Vibrio campbellii (strain ATCC BAA-1116) TaxID=2902295 RepID=A7N1M8_VIBC1|nr:hypothetical protein VIBHAR_01561 [Vibrio campbellii ATCC BAA-1116]
MKKVAVVTTPNRAILNALVSQIIQMDRLKIDLVALPVLQNQLNRVLHPKIVR